MSVRPRLTIDWLMALIAILAIDLAALGACWPYAPYPVVCLVVIALEIALVRATRGGGAVRVFWLGFAALGWASVTPVIVLNLRAEPLPLCLHSTLLLHSHPLWLLRRFFWF